MLNYNLYIRGMLEAIEKIEKTCKSRKSLEDINIFDMTLMRLQTIGENSIKIPTKIKNARKEIKWKNIRRLRNVISHKYQMVDKDLIWNFIDKEIPKLQKALIKIKQEINFILKKELKGGKA